MCNSRQSDPTVMRRRIRFHHEDLTAALPELVDSDPRLADVVRAFRSFLCERLGHNLVVVFARSDILKLEDGRRGGHSAENFRVHNVGCSGLILALLVDCIR